MNVARRLGEPVVAVDVLDAGPVETPEQLFEARGAIEVVTRVGRQLGFTHALEVVHQAAMIASCRLRDAQLVTCPPDLLIRPVVSRVGLFAFDLANYAFEQGVAAARQALPELERLTRPGSAWAGGQPHPQRQTALAGAERQYWPRPRH